jgi:hypothetical protein
VPQERYVIDNDTTPAMDPEPGRSMIVNFKFPSKEKVEVKPGEQVALTATLYWAGKKQDSMTRGLFLAYK